ncbi:MAG: hypothetical protein GC179_04285 [Anaerolineaceae bacterium]|nr:hypothetical protein [Anaerolineaceae bacterium]
MRDKQFDNWIKNSLNNELMLTKQARDSAWTQIQMRAVQPTASFAFDDDFDSITSPVTACEPLHVRILQWIAYVFTQETTYHKAHNNSVHYYKAKPNYCNGLTLHDLEMMRHRWTCPV